jgi:hypothetical protein
MKTLNSRKRRRAPEGLKSQCVLVVDKSISSLQLENPAPSTSDSDDPYSFKVEAEVSHTRPQLSPQFLAGLAAGSFAVVSYPGVNLF